MSHTLFCSHPTCSDPALAADLAVQENPANRAGSGSGGRKKRAVGETTNFWAPQRHLRIRFWEGTPKDLQEAVFSTGSLWLEYASLTFELVAPDAEAEITIQMLDPEEGINYCWPGTEALLPEAMPTMKLSVLPEEDHFQYTVLHEFGHMLGALHEHQHPDANIPWDTEGLYTQFEEDGKTRQHVDEQFFNKLERSKVYNTLYDPKSIMHYNVPTEWALNGWSLVIENRVISEKDKAFMRIVYPPRAD